MKYKCWLEKDPKTSLKVTTKFPFEGATDAAEYFLEELYNLGYWDDEEVPHQIVVYTEDDNNQIKKLEVYTEHKVSFDAYEQE